MTESTQHSAKWAKRLVIGAGCFGVLMSLIAVWLVMATRSPAAKYSRPKTPKPNAFDYYVRAGYAITNMDKVVDAVWGRRSYSLAEKEALLKANTQALTLLQRGFTCDYLHPAVRTNQAVMDMMQSLSHIRSLARLKRLEGDVREERGQWGGALESHLDTVRLGKDLPRGDGLISLLVGIAIESIGRRGIWKSVDHLDAAEAKAAARRLEGMVADRAPFPETLAEDRLVGHAVIEDLSDKAHSHNILTWFFMRLEDASAVPWMSDSREPYAARRREAARSILRLAIPWFSIKMNTYAKRACRAADNSARDALLATVLALHAYRLEHDGYPARLRDLVPSYLKQVPSDPFSPADQLHYKRVGTRYVLYSVGPDGQDNGGKQIICPKRPGRSRYISVEPDSKGDLVAGADIF